MERAGRGHHVELTSELLRRHRSDSTQRERMTSTPRAVESSSWSERRWCRPRAADRWCDISRTRRGVMSRRQSAMFHVKHGTSERTPCAVWGRSERAAGMIRVVRRSGAATGWVGERKSGGLPWSRNRGAAGCPRVRSRSSDSEAMRARAHVFHVKHVRLHRPGGGGQWKHGGGRSRRHVIVRAFSSGERGGCHPAVPVMDAEEASPLSARVSASCTRRGRGARGVRRPAWLAWSRAEARGTKRATGTRVGRSTWVLWAISCAHSVDTVN